MTRDTREKSIQVCSRLMRRYAVPCLKICIVLAFVGSKIVVGDVLRKRIESLSVFVGGAGNGFFLTAKIHFHYIFVFQDKQSFVLGFYSGNGSPISAYSLPESYSSRFHPAKRLLAVCERRNTVLSVSLSHPGNNIIL